MRENQQSKIAFFLPSLAGGGAEKAILNLAKGFSARGFSVDLVLATAEGPYLPEVSEDIRIIDLRSTRVLTSFPGLLRYLRKNRPMAMVSALDHANLMALWAKAVARVPTRMCITIHTTHSQIHSRSRFSRSFFRFLMRHFYPKADSVVAVSGGVAQDLSETIGLPRDRVEIIYNPVLHPEVFAKSLHPVAHPWLNSDSGPIVLSVGRFTDAKDFSTLIRAFSIVREKWNLKLIILGDGELRPTLEQLIEDLGLGNYVDLPGFQNNPYNYMAKSDVFVLSSKREGLPTVLIEALALSRSVVSTDCKSGPAEILQQGKLGSLVPVGDISALAFAIDAALGTTTKSTAELETFSLAHSTSAYLKILQGISSG